MWIAVRVRSGAGQRGENAEGAVGTVVVVLVAPVGDEHLGFEERVELLDR
jgi:hypothetical protein